MGCQCPRGSSVLAAEKSILSKPRHAAVSEKTLPEAGRTVFSGSRKGSWEPVGPYGRKTLPGGLDWRQSGVYSQLPGDQKTNSGLQLRPL